MIGSRNFSSHDVEILTKLNERLVIFIMSATGELIFDRSADNHDEIWDDTELIRAYDRAQRQIQNRLRNDSKPKKNSSQNKSEKSSQIHNKTKTKNQTVAKTPSMNFPVPIPTNMITPPKNEDDALNSMLMSWYMAGYHAGLLAAKNWKPES